jgi:hypothetical protein
VDTGPQYTPAAGVEKWDSPTAVGLHHGIELREPVDDSRPEDRLATMISALPPRDYNEVPLEERDGQA